MPVIGCILELHSILTRYWRDSIASDRGDRLRPHIHFPKLCSSDSLMTSKIGVRRFSLTIIERVI